MARRTGTVTEFGGRFDGEVDAFLILVLSVAAAPTVGWWVLAAGVVRYAFGAAGRLLPWLRGPLEFRYWRKVVTAVVGIVLTVVVADLLPQRVMVGLALVALALLAESFGRDVWWLWRHRPRERTAPAGRHGLGGRASASRPPCWPGRSCGSRWWPRHSPTGSPQAPSCASRWRPSSWPAPPWWSRAVRRAS